jgi:hypothetical protein
VNVVIRGPHSLFRKDETKRCGVLKNRGGYTMRNAILAVLLGFSLTALLAGCFDVVNVVPPDGKGPEITPPGTEEDQPFPVNIKVSKDARSIVSATSHDIKFNGLRNFAQLIVVGPRRDEGIVTDPEAIVAYGESRKKTATDTSGSLQISGMTEGDTYKFILLMGYWEWDPDKNKQDGPTTILGYNEDASPVVLAAGFYEEEYKGGDIITVMMYPLVIETVFETIGTKEEPEVGQPTSLQLNGNPWIVTWKIDERGFQALRNAHSRTDDQLPVVSGTYFKQIASQPDPDKKAISDTKLISNPLVFDIGKYEKLDDIKTGTVYFNVEYVPGATTLNWGDWNNISCFTLLEDKTPKPPIWIIRNGLNDKAQDGKTDFSQAGIDSAAYNGNGGIVFTVAKGFTDNNGNGFPDGTVDENGKEDVGFPYGLGAASSEDLILGNGSFNFKDFTVGFSTAGYSGDATVYYNILEQDSGYDKNNPLPYSKFEKVLGERSAGNYTGIDINNLIAKLSPPPATFSTLWLMFMKNDKVSNRIAIPINGTNDVSGHPEWWADENAVYVRADEGNDLMGDGSWSKPYKTLDRGLTQATTVQKKTVIVVIGEATSSGSGESTVTLKKDNLFLYQNSYSLTIRGQPPHGNAVLKAAANKRVLYIEGTGNVNQPVNVTLKDITLTGGSNVGFGAGIYIKTKGATVTLGEGAIITRNGDVDKKSGGKTTRGAGVCVDNGAVFILDGGEISDNWQSAGSASYFGGGGLAVKDNSSTAYLINGKITGNYAYIDGGGVVVSGSSNSDANRARVYMYDGVEISGNEAGDDGGGVEIDYYAEFHLYGGKIIGNYAKSQGGGVRLECGRVLMYPADCTLTYPAGYTSSVTTTKGSFVIAGMGDPNANQAKNNQTDSICTSDSKDTGYGEAYNKKQASTSASSSAENDTINASAIPSWFTPANGVRSDLKNNL